MSMKNRAIYFSFTGKTAEYSKIWIKNLLLTIITLGVYSAWAGVITRKYFYKNTHIDNNSFNFTANPKYIAITRIFIIVFIAMFLLLYKYKITEYQMFLIYFGFLFIIHPLMMIGSYRFNANKSTYRGTNFTFKGNFINILLINSLPLITLVFFSFFPVSEFILYCLFILILPFVEVLNRKYFINNLSYGSSKFSLNLRFRSYYYIYISRFILCIPLAAVIIFLSPLISPILYWLSKIFSLIVEFDIRLNHEIDDPIIDQMIRNSFVMPYLFYDYYAYYVSAFFAMPLIFKHIVSIPIQIHTIDNTKLENIEFHFNYNINSRINMLWLAITNLFVIILTCGLAIPWTRIRNARYKANNTYLTIEKNSKTKKIEGHDKIFDSIGDDYSSIKGKDPISDFIP